MRPYAELLYYTQLNPNTIGRRGIRDQFGLKEPEDLMAFAGSYDYGEANAKKWNEPSKSGDHRIVRYIKAGHESMIELVNATFFFECSRVVTHELVRHRAGMSYQQASQRFIKYSNLTLDDLVIPTELENNEEYLEALRHSLRAYEDARAAGIAPQLARYCLPNAMGTQIIVNGNLRSWRHILKLRMDTSAQPEMQELMGQVHEQLVELFPNAMYGVLDGERGVR